MKQYSHLREKARTLRREHKLSLDEIVERLSLPRTTVYGWIRDIPIPRTQKQSEGQRLGTQAMREKYRLLREEAYDEAYQQAPALLQEPSFRDFVVLYMAEGYRRDRNIVSLNNSNVRIVKLANKWIRKLTTNKIRYSLQYHIDHDEEELRHFWANELDVKRGDIYVIRKSNSGRLSGRQWRSEHGVLDVRVGDTYLRARLQAWMDYVQAQW